MAKLKLTHTDPHGKANMVDVSSKPDQVRTAIAEGIIYLQPETLDLVLKNNLKKGDVLTVAETAGIQGAKRASELIPLCHPLLITKIDIKTELLNNGIQVNCQVRCIGKTGVEMEALTGVSVALLTIYDMCKAVDKNMVIGDVHLIEKTKL